MNILITPSRLHGTVRIPASKSMAHRLLICAALAEGTSVISGVDMSSPPLWTCSPHSGHRSGRRAAPLP